RFGAVILLVFGQGQRTGVGGVLVGLGALVAGGGQIDGGRAGLEGGGERLVGLFPVRGEIALGGIFVGRKLVVGPLLGRVERVVGRFNARGAGVFRLGRLPLVNLVGRKIVGV